MSCKLSKDKKRVKKCMKQQQMPIFEYLPDEDDEENLMSPNLASQHYKQLQRQQLNVLLNQPETNNNNLQQPSRNTRAMVLLNTATGERQQQPTTFYPTGQQALRSSVRNSPTSQTNPNYIHAFLNERELINRNDEEDDDDGGFLSAGSPEFGELNAERQNLMVHSTAPIIRSSFKTQNLAQLTNQNRQRPILIKDHASTIHFIRSSSKANKPKSLIVHTNRTLSSSTLSALLNGRANQSHHQFNTFFNESLTDERRPILSSSPNLHPMHALASSVTPTSSQNTTLTSANATSSFSNANSSPQSFSQRTTPQSKNRLRNFDGEAHDRPNTKPTSPTRRAALPNSSNSNSPKSNTSPINSPTNESLTRCPDNSPVNSSPTNGSTNSSTSSPNSKNLTSSNLSPSSTKSAPLTNHSPPKDTTNNIELRQPAWLQQPSPIKQTALLRQSSDESYKKTSQTISSVGENLF